MNQLQPSTETSEQEATTGAEHAHAGLPERPRVSEPIPPGQRIAHARKKPRIEDAGKKLGGARKDEDNTREPGDNPSGQAKLLDELWPEPADWRDLLSTQEPQRVVAQMVLRGNLASDPHAGGYFGYDESFWRTNYVKSLQALRDVLNDPRISPTKLSLQDAYCLKVGYDINADRLEDRLRMSAIGKGYRRRLNTPFTFSPINDLRIKYLVTMGWATDLRISDKFAYGALELTRRSGGERFWRAVKGVASAWEYLNQNEYPSEELALMEAMRLASQHLDEDKTKTKVSKPWKWSRPINDESVVRIHPQQPASRGRQVEEIIERFGVRGVEFGNWIPQSERQEIVDQCYDALEDFVTTMRMPDRFASLGGRIGIGFGSRGQGLSRAMAHFEPGQWVVHLTRKSGAGSVGHEYGHGMDHFIAMRNKKASASSYFPWRYASQMLDVVNLEKYIRPDDRGIFDALKAWQHEVIGSQFHDDAYRMDALEKKKTSYWASTEELFARSFETYIYEAMKAQGCTNDYLVYGVDEQYQRERTLATLPIIYPLGQERLRVTRTMHGFVQACRSAWGC